MLQRSSITASEEERQAFYEELKQQSMWPLWADQGNPNGEPKSGVLPFVWHWRDIRPQAMRATKLVGTKEALRRVLCLANPGLDGRSGSTRTLSANIQIVMPGEIARAHHHNIAALRFIIEASGGYTVVDGDIIPMAPGDLILTPNWAYHDHANDSDAPAIWLDGLDVPLVRGLEIAFQEEFPEETQPIGEVADLSLAKYGTGGLRPAWETQTRPHSPLTHFPWSEVKPALDRIAAVASGSAYDGIILEYTNPATGGPVMPTIGCYAQLLRPRQHTESHRHTSSTVYHVVEGEGYTLVDGQRLDWESKDVFVVPAWAHHEHVNLSQGQPAYLFSFSEAPALRALDLYREEPSAP